MIDIAAEATTARSGPDRTTDEMTTRVPTMRVGLLGAGRIGRIHGLNVAARADAELVAITDAVPAAAAALVFGEELRQRRLPHPQELDVDFFHVHRHHRQAAAIDLFDRGAEWLARRPVQPRAEHGIDHHANQFGLLAPGHCTQSGPARVLPGALRIATQRRHVGIAPMPGQNRQQRRAEQEKPALDTLLARQVTDPTVRFGNYRYNEDPTTQSERIGDDTIEATRLGLMNLDRLGRDYLVRDWSRENQVWFAAVQVEKRMMFIILTLIVAVAAFNLVSTLVMTVTDKRADIAILRTLGASPASIMAVFVVQGALVGVVGTLAGLLLGLGVAFNIDVIVPALERALGASFLPQDVYLISRMPSDPRASDVVPVALIALALALVATLYPSWRASRVNPAEALRHE